MPEPRAVVEDIVLLSQSRLLNIFVMRSRYPLATVLRPDYWADVTLSGLRRGDLIQLVCDVPGGGLPGHALLTVDESRPRDRVLHVSLLQPYVRTRIVAGTVEAAEVGEDKAAVH